MIFVKQNRTQLSSMNSLKHLDTSKIFKRRRHKNTKKNYLQIDYFNKLVMFEFNISIRWNWLFY